MSGSFIRQLGEAARETWGRSSEAQVHAPAAALRGGRAVKSDCGQIANSGAGIGRSCPGYPAKRGLWGGEMAGKTGSKGPPDWVPMPTNTHVLRT